MSDFHEFEARHSTITPLQESGTKLAAAIVKDIMSDPDITTTTKNRELKKVKESITDEMREEFIENRNMRMPFDKAVEIVQHQIKQHEQRMVAQSKASAIAKQKERVAARSAHVKTSYKPYEGVDVGTGLSKHAGLRKRLSKKLNKNLNKNLRKTQKQHNKK